MWLTLTIISAFLLGTYDVAKKQALKKNGVLSVLLAATAISSVILSPMAATHTGTAPDHLRMLFKALLVSASWISGMIALKLLPITTASTLKASRPFLVVIFSIFLFNERMNALQWTGTALALSGITMLGFTSKREGISFRSNRGIWAMAVSIVAGVASALYDKALMKTLDPLFVQSWTNIYITLILAVCVFLQPGSGKGERFRWDWTILLIAVLITAADACYFFSLKDSAALLSVVSLLRRGSVIVSFVLGAILFKEKNVGRKAIDIALVMAGITFLLLGSS